MSGQDHKMFHHLPVHAYTSQDWFDEEQEKIFSNTWRFAGFVEDVQDAGDYITVQAGLNNILVVKGHDGQLRAFHNLCRHRGTQLLRAAGKGGKAITCPYHDWTYNLKGDLVGLPEHKSEFKGIDKKCYGLKAASVGVWRSMIFVHPSPDAGDVSDWFAPIAPYLGPHKVEELIEYPDTEVSYEIKANWKVVVENYIDHYHLAHLHSGTLSMYDHKNAEFGFYGPHFAFYEPLHADYAANLEKNAPYPLVLSPKDAGAWVPMLFPALGLVETESSWSHFHIEPIAPDKTKVTVRSRLKQASALSFKKQEWVSAEYWYKKIRGKYNKGADKADPMTSGDVMAEDVYACEQQQKAFMSPYFETGPAAEFGEKPILDHQKVVREYMKIKS